MSGFANRWKSVFRRRAIVLILATAALVAGTVFPSAGAQQGGDGTAIRIFADADWYRSRSEPEQRWRGTLHERQQDAGPGARLGLPFSLDTGSGVFPVYAAGFENTLKSFLGRPILVEGKLVRLESEGFGSEIWIASVRPLPPAQ
jgi:hypothetical protein